MPPNGTESGPPVGNGPAGAHRSIPLLAKRNRNRALMVTYATWIMGIKEEHTYLGGILSRRSGSLRDTGIRTNDYDRDSAQCFSASPLEQRSCQV